MIVCSGCGGSASLVLKTPVSNQCAQAGLVGCDELSEGVLLFAEGKQGEGAAKLQAGAAQNPPEKVKQFAAQLDTLSSLPGAGKYAGALRGVVATLTLSASSSSPAERATLDDDAALASRSPLASPAPRGALTADTDVAQIRSFVAELPTNPPDWCEKFGKGTACLVLSRGPFFLTDARASAPDCEGQFLSIIAEGQVSVELESPLSFHGARVLVPERAALVFGQRPKPREGAPSADEALEQKPGQKAAAKSLEKPALNKQAGQDSDAVVLDDLAPEWSCSLYVSGFVPYETNPTATSQPSPNIERPPEKSWNQDGGF